MKRDTRIPRLSWLCRRDGPHFSFTLGSAVEQFEGGFFEGVWDGDFTNTEALPKALLFGSGALLRNRVLFLTPKHLYDQIYVVRDVDHGVDFISNSLCCCLSAANAPDEFLQLLDRTLVLEHMEATRLGAHLAPLLAAENSGFQLYRMAYHNFSIGTDGSFRLSPNWHQRSFNSFSSYKEHLLSTMQRLFANGSDPTRAFQFRPLTALSTGYDTTLGAALAAQLGCKEAVTFAGSLRGANDAGTATGDALGLRVHEFSHPFGTHVETLVGNSPGQVSNIANEFFATAGAGDDLIFQAFEPVLSDRIFLSGFLGDAAWKINSTMRAGLPTIIKYGKSLTEFRLRVGFAHVPVPSIGAMLPKSIAAISRSDEMKPFSVGGNYDRPIPRRIAEEAGIPRSFFGMKKAAAAPDITNRHQFWLTATREIMKRYTAS